jgi:hypothetical protein
MHEKSYSRRMIKNRSASEEKRNADKREAANGLRFACAFTRP